MKKPPIVFVARVLAVVFSVAIATVYISCRSSQQAEQAKQPAESPDSKADPSADPPGEDDVIPLTTKSGRVYLPGSKSIPVEPRFLPGSKSAPFDFKIGPFDHEKEPDADPKQQDPAFLPGSKSAPIDPELLEKLLRESEENKNDQPGKQKDKNNNP